MQVYKYARGVGVDRRYATQGVRSATECVCCVCVLSMRQAALALLNQLPPVRSAHRVLLVWGTTATVAPRALNFRAQLGGSAPLPDLLRQLAPGRAMLGDTGH